MYTNAASDRLAPSPTARRAVRPLAPTGWRDYVRLANLDIYDYHLATPLVLAMALPAYDVGPNGLATLVLFLLGGIAMFAGACAFDDVTGYRDGSDVANYGPDAQSRRLARKPLIAGSLDVPQAVRFGWLATALCIACWTLAVLVAPARPWWAVAATVASASSGFQYSWWLRLSYRGWQEFLLAAHGWVFVLAPYGLITGRAWGPSRPETGGGFVLVLGLVFGLGPLLFGVYSNVSDIAGDRAVGRRTVAVLASARGNAAFVAGISLLEAALLVLPSVTGIAPWWFAALMSPVIALRAAQFTLGMLAGEILRARRLGIHIHRICCGLLVIACLVNGGAA